MEVKKSVFILLWVLLVEALNSLNKYEFRNFVRVFKRLLCNKIFFLKGKKIGIIQANKLKLKALRSGSKDSNNLFIIFKNFFGIFVWESLKF